eukprot:TRINITY_DN9896_c0_g2_i2.p1 TRINITY_DN9896_c0_g2~~TRINITY_DN9896_c0_g2_i2.p1  ORF type:complete len:462 (-),score=116.00 TRINITY_DN9896_c0_g2_i2:58-1389(-)
MIPSTYGARPPVLPTYGSTYGSAAASARALDAADGVIDGKHFGAPIAVGGVSTYGTPALPTTTLPTYGSTALPAYGSSYGTAANARALDAADGVIDGKYFGAPITTAAAPSTLAGATTSYRSPMATSYYGTGALARPPAIATTPGNALALDAADGVIDGKHFGSQITAAPTGYSTSLYGRAPLSAQSQSIYGRQQNVVVGEEIVNVPMRVPIVKTVAVPPPPPPLPVQVQIQYVDRPVPVPQYLPAPAPVVQEKVVDKIVEKIVVQRVYACSACGLDIEGEMLETTNGKYHRHCLIICAGCGNQILYNAFSAMGQQWHRECFLCGICGQNCADGYVVHNGKAVHQVCLEPPKPAVTPGMAAKRAIKAKTFEEAVRLDEKGGGEPDGKYHGITIECDDPRWEARARERGYDHEATWECSDERMAAHHGSGKSVVSKDGIVDGNV